MTTEGGPGPRIECIHELPADLEALVRAGLQEDFRALARLRDDWISGENRFNRPGEALFRAKDQGRLVGIVGLNRDPFVEQMGGAPHQVGRIRRLYVLPDSRRGGIGRALVQAVVDAAQTHFTTLGLRTHDPRADAFYRACGFSPVQGQPAVTHSLCLGDS